MISRDLALVRGALERLGRQEPGADELLGDRRGAARPAGDGVEAGRHDADGVEARVDPEVLVLDGGRRVEHLAGSLVERDELALEVAEAGELDLAGPVVDDRLLLELEVGEGCLRGRAGRRRSSCTRPRRRPRRCPRRAAGDEEMRIGMAIDDRDRWSSRPSLRLTLRAPVDGAGAARGWSASVAAR